MKYFDRIKDTTTTAGTGNITVSGTAQSGFRTFSAVLTTADTFYYCIDGGAEWETGVGTMVSTNVFSRSVKESSNSDALVPFSAGTKTVFVTAAADFFTGLPSAYDAYGSAATVSGALSTHAGLTTSAHGGVQPSSTALTDVAGKWTPASTTVGTQLTLAEGTNNGTNTVTIKPPAALSANYTLTLPSDDGTPNQLLQTDGAGNLTWTSSVNVGTYEILYSNAGDVTVKTGTLGRIVKVAGTVTEGSVRFGTAGTTGDTTIAVKNGAATVGTCTIASGGTTGTLTLSSTTLAAGDVLTIDCTAAATTTPTNMTITMLVTRS